MIKLDVWNLRCRLQSLNDMIPRIIFITVSPPNLLLGCIYLRWNLPFSSRGTKTHSKIGENTIENKPTDDVGCI